METTIAQGLHVTDDSAGYDAGNGERGDCHVQSK